MAQTLLTPAAQKRRRLKRRCRRALTASGSVCFKYAATISLNTSMLAMTIMRQRQHRQCAIPRNADVLLEEQRFLDRICSSTRKTLLDLGNMLCDARDRVLLLTCACQTPFPAVSTNRDHTAEHISRKHSKIQTGILT